MDDQVMGLAQQGVGRVQDAVGGLTGDAKTQVKGKLNEAAGAAREGFGQLKDGVRDQVEITFEDVRSRVQDELGALEASVIEKPLPALAIAGAIGMVLGVLLFGRGKTVYRHERR
jgi:uncharacterized protein YjbJ (UPF0337 family)